MNDFRQFFELVDMKSFSFNEVSDNVERNPIECFVHEAGLENVELIQMKEVVGR